MQEFRQRCLGRSLALVYRHVNSDRSTSIALSNDMPGMTAASIVLDCISYRELAPSPASERSLY